jgi:hypothetical protein
MKLADRLRAVSINEEVCADCDHVLTESAAVLDEIEGFLERLVDIADRIGENPMPNVYGLLERVRTGV